MVERVRVLWGAALLVSTLLVVGAPPGATTAGSVATVSFRLTAPAQTGEPAALAGRVRPRVARPLVLQRRTSGTWTRIKRFRSSPTGRFSTTVTTLAHPERYRVRARRVRIRDRVYAPVASPSVEVSDTVVPGTPTGLTAILGAGQASATWSPTLAPDLAGYHVYYAQHETGPWNPVPEWMLDERPGVIIPADERFEHWFAVASVDQAGNESPRAITRAVPGNEQPTLVPPDDVTVDSTAPGRVHVTWTGISSDAVLRYGVYVAPAADGPWTQAGQPTFATGHNVAELIGGRTYWFHVVTLDENDNASERSDIVSATVPRDGLAPPVPAAVSAYPGNGAVQLAWDRDTSPGGVEPWKGEVVYEAPSADGPWTVVPAERIYDQTSKGAILRGVPNDEKRWYQVTRTDAAGDESAPGGPVAATPSAAISRSWAQLGWGRSHACGVKSDGTLWCWGAGELGAIGVADGRSRAFPTQIGADHWSAVAAGEDETCALREDGTLWCTGVGVVQQSSTLGRIGAISDWTAIGAGSTLRCALRASTHRIHCWGMGAFGFHGATKVAEPHEDLYVGAGLPSMPNEFSGIQDIQGGMGCATVLDGRIYCWSSSEVGYLPGDGWRSVDVGRGYRCGTKTDATLWCWGTNGSGQLGIGTTTPSATPVQVAPGTTWKSVTAEGETTCAIDTGDALWCWGDNSAGQVDISWIDKSVPTPSRATGSWQTAHPSGPTCALELDRTLWCWRDKLRAALVGTVP